MLSFLEFDKCKDPKIAILVKERAFDKNQIYSNYIKPLVKQGIPQEKIIALSLEYNTNDKAPVSFIKDKLTQIEKVVQFYKLSHLFVTDAAYFKVLAKVRTTERSFGYSLQSLYPGVQAVLGLNYQSLYFNTSLQDKLSLGLLSLVKSFNQQEGVFEKTPITNPRYPKTLQEVEDELNDLLTQDTLTCDIETNGLHLSQGKPLTIAFAESRKSGCAFGIYPGFGAWKDQVLKQFFIEYKNKLVFHNATFDIGRLVRYYFMGNSRDIKGMLIGLNKLCNNFDDTKLMAYVQKNTCSLNSFSLKDLAFEYVGNYALEDIKAINLIDMDEVLTYNLTDACATYYLYEKYKDSLEIPIYKNIYKPALKTVTQMELCGMPINLEVLSETGQKLHLEKNKYLNKIKENRITKELENRLQLDAAISANLKLKKLRKTKEDFSELEFNPDSPKQVRILLYEVLKFIPTRFTDTKLPSTDAKALQSLINIARGMS